MLAGPAQEPAAVGARREDRHREGADEECGAGIALDGDHVPAPAKERGQRQRQARPPGPAHSGGEVGLRLREALGRAVRQGAGRGQLEIRLEGEERRTRSDGDYQGELRRSHPAQPIPDQEPHGER